MAVNQSYNSEILQDINMILLGRITRKDGSTACIDKSKAISRFEEQIAVFAKLWKVYKKAEKQKDKIVNSFRWLRRNYNNLNQAEIEYPLPPDPTVWEPDNELPCAYAALTTIWDQAQKTASKCIHPGIWDEHLFAWMIFRCERYDEARTERALALVKDDLLTHCGQDTKNQGKAGNVQGMSWRAAKDKAEKYVASQDFPGITKLHKIIGCAPNTMRKAINNSEKLKEAELKCGKQSSSVSAVTLTNKVIASCPSNRQDDPSVVADTNSLLAKLVKEAPPEKRDETQAAIDNMNQEGKQSLAFEFAKQIDDARQDDPRKRKPRRRKP